MLFYTIGHSTRSLDEFLNLLERYKIHLLLDGRTVPRSRRVPHFNSESLARHAEPRGIEYRHFKPLGGLRKPSEVRHIISKARLQIHALTPFAVVETGRLTYPKANPSGRLL